MIMSVKLVLVVDFVQKVHDGECCSLFKAERVK